MLGFYGLFLSVTCYFISLIAANLIQTNFLTGMIISIIVSGALIFLQWVFFYLLFDYEYAGYALTDHFIPRFFYTVATMPVSYYFNRALAIQIRSKEE